MGLKLKLGTGEEIVVPFNRDSALTVTYVTTIDGVQAERAEAHADIVAIEIVDDPAPATPEIVTMTGAEAAAQDVQVPISEDASTQPPVNPDTGGEPGAEPPVQEPATTEAAATAVVDESFLQKVQDKLGLGHETVVADAQAAVTAATAGDATIDRVTAAIADVTAALAAYPDSAELADAKFQLESLVGTPPAAQGA